MNGQFYTRNSEIASNNFWERGLGKHINGFAKCEGDQSPTQPDGRSKPNTARREIAGAAWLIELILFQKFLG